MLPGYPIFFANSNITQCIEGYQGENLGYFKTIALTGTILKQRFYPFLCLVLKEKLIKRLTKRDDLIEASKEKDVHEFHYQEDHHFGHKIEQGMLSHFCSVVFDAL